MARKPYTARKSLYFRMRRVRVSSEQLLGTLASDTAIATSLTGVADGAYRLMTARLAWTLVNLTQGQGPITVGFAHSDYTVAEIKECLEAFAAISQGDKIAQERSNRLIRTVGTFGNAGSGLGVAALNDGKPIYTKLNWLVAIGDSVNFFAFNEDTGALSVTDPSLNVQGDIFVRDST